MKMILRLFIVSCACFCAVHAADTVKVLQKTITFSDAKTRQKLSIEAFAFVNGNEKETANTRWYSTFPCENVLAFYWTQQDLADFFAVNHLITNNSSVTIEYDLAANGAIKIVEPGQKATSLLTMQATISPEVQIFKELVILLGKKDKNGLQAFVAKHSIEKIENITSMAIIALAGVIPVPDDLENFSKILEGKVKITKPTQITGKYIFVPAEIMLALHEAAAQEQNASGNQA